MLTYAKEGDMILNVAEALGITIPTSCRTGICGTCTMDLEDPMWEENLSKASQGVEREGYIPFHTCCAKATGVPVGHKEMVIDCWRMSSGAKNTNTPGGQINLAPAMKQFQAGWEAEYRTTSKPAKPELNTKVDRYGNFIAGKKGDNIFWTYGDTRKRDRQVKSIMREKLDAKVLGTKLANKKGVNENPGGAAAADENIKLVTSSKMDDDELSHGNSVFLSDGQGSARLIGYRREGMPTLDERHPLPVTNLKELRRLREKEDEEKENSLSLWPGTNGNRYPSNQYENHEDEWDNEPPIITHDLEFNRALFRPLVSHPVVDKDGKWVRTASTQNKSYPKNLVEQIMVEDRSHALRAEVQEKKPLLERVFGSNVLTVGKKVTRLAKKRPTLNRLKVSKSAKLSEFIPGEEHQAAIAEHSNCVGKRVIECSECSGEGFVMQVDDEGRMYREECSVCCGAGVTCCGGDSSTAKLNNQMTPVGATT